nr:MAG TPA: hypothetical protein [Caudoviricetes sp.]
MTRAPFQNLPKFFGGDGTAQRGEGVFGFTRSIFVPCTWYEVLRGERGLVAVSTLPGPARQGGATKEHSVQVHFVRFEPARSGGSPTSKSPPPTSVSLRSTSAPSTSYWVLRCSLRSHVPRRLRRLGKSTSYYVLGTRNLVLSPLRGLRAENGVLGTSYPH